VKWWKEDLFNFSLDNTDVAIAIQQRNPNKGKKALDEGGSYW